MREDVFMDIRFCNILANVAHVHRIRAQFWLGPMVSICTVPKVNILLISWGTCASEWILEKKKYNQWFHSMYMCSPLDERCDLFL